MVAIAAAERRTVPATDCATLSPTRVGKPRRDYVQLQSPRHRPPPPTAPHRPLPTTHHPPPITHPPPPTAHHPPPTTHYPQSGEYVGDYKPLYPGSGSNTGKAHQNSPVSLAASSSHVAADALAPMSYTR